MTEKTCFSEELLSILETARGYANGDLGDASYSDAHILLALLDDDQSVRRFIATCDLDDDRVEPEDLTSDLLSVLEMAPNKQAQYIQDAEKLENDFHDYCMQTGIDNANGVSFLNYIAGLNTWCGRSLYDAGFTPDLITSYLKGHAKPEAKSDQKAARSNANVLTLSSSISGAGKQISGPQDTDNTSIVDQFCTVLSSSSKPDHVPEDVDVPGLYETLTRKYKNNAALLGAHSSAATKIAQELAWQCVKGDAPKALEGRPVYKLDLEEYLKTINTFDANERVNKAGKLAQDILDGLDKMQPRPILFIENMVAAVKTSSNTKSNDTVIVATLADVFSGQSQVPVIGAMTPEFSDNKDIREMILAMSNFDEFNVANLAKGIERNQIRAELDNVKHEYEEHYQLDISDEALNVVTQAQKHLEDASHFHEAGELLDEACAAKQVQTEQDSQTPSTLTADDAIQFFEKRYGIKKDMLQSQENVMTAEAFARRLKEHVIGQDDAVQTLTEGFKLNAAGLQISCGTRGNYLFAGPTGVGKTELCNALSNIYNCKLIQEDMGNYQEKHEVAKLVGAPPGYIGYDKGSALINKLKETQDDNEQAHAVILLDEIEKAHPDVMNALLAPMSTGTIQDSDGNPIDISNCTIVMTSNVGQQELQEKLRQEQSGGIGFLASVENQEAAQSNDNSMPVEKMRQFVDEKICENFSPEFRNRLTSIVHFNHLTRENLDQILDNVKQDVEKQYKLNISLEFTKAAREHIIHAGYSREMGARHLNRAVEKHLNLKLADAYDKGCIGQDEHVQVDYDESRDELVLRANDKGAQDRNAESGRGDPKSSQAPAPGRSA